MEVDIKVYTFISYNGDAVNTYFLSFSIICAIWPSMPTEKPKIIFVADQELLDRVDDFRFENRINTRSEAIRRLLEEALKKYERNAKE